MRLLSYLPKIACGMSLVTLSILFSAGAVSAEELVGTPVPIEAGAEIPPSPHIVPTPPPAEAVESMARQAANEQEIVRNMERMFEQGMGGHAGHPQTADLDFIVPVVAMLLIFGGPILLIVFLMVLNYRSKQRRQANINMNIDKLLAAGRDIPVELLRGDEPRSADAEESGNLNKGVKNICVGTGILIFLTLVADIQVASIAFILIGLGISRVIVWKLSQTNKPETQTIAAQD